MRYHEANAPIKETPYGEQETVQKLFNVPLSKINTTKRHINYITVYIFCQYIILIKIAIPASELRTPC